MSPDQPTRTVPIRFEGLRGYDAIIGEGVLKLVRDRIAAILGPGRRLFIIGDHGLPATHVAALSGNSPHGSAKADISWNPSETDKTPVQATRFLEAMARAHIDRSGVVIALGGGITGDVAGFAAALYQRGIPWVSCPTTLLAMVDSSVGGKTGVNLSIPGEHPGETLVLKNQVGSFHHPILVAADTSTLTSLPERMFRSGLAECIKHAMIGLDWGDAALLNWTRTSLPTIAQRHPGTLIDLVARNLAIKAAVVAADERESGGGGEEDGNGSDAGRMALNLGHTFAHAIETLPHLSPDGDPAHAPLQHGEAVALGLIAASRCAAAAGLCPTDLADEVVSLVRASGLPTAVRDLPPESAILERMFHDKKVRNGVLRLILPVDRGRVRLFSNPAREAVRAGLNSIRA